jgi:phytoene desaturase (3,4-didehydrolycopene-forming)
MDSPFTEYDAPAIYSGIIELQVGQERFKARRSTLVEQSTYFKSLLSGRWNPQADGSYFVDADPGLFAHILNYLRRPDIFPLFYDDVKGHDIPKYYALLGEARYFGIDALAEWIENRGYAKVLSYEYSCKVMDRDDSRRTEEPSDTSLEYRLTGMPRKMWICPHELPSHIDNVPRCERECYRFPPEQRRNSALFEDGPPAVLAIRKRTLLNIK